MSNSYENFQGSPFNGIVGQSNHASMSRNMSWIPASFSSPVVVQSPTTSLLDPSVHYINGTSVPSTHLRNALTQNSGTSHGGQGSNPQPATTAIPSEPSQAQPLIRVKPIESLLERRVAPQSATSASGGLWTSVSAAVPKPVPSLRFPVNNQPAAQFRMMNAHQTARRTPIPNGFHSGCENGITYAPRTSILRTILPPVQLQRCLECGSKFLNESALKQHIEMMHKRKNLLDASNSRDGLTITVNPARSTTSIPTSVASTSSATASNGNSSVRKVGNVLIRPASSALAKMKLEADSKKPSGVQIVKLQHKTPESRETSNVRAVLPESATYSASLALRRMAQASKPALEVCSEPSTMNVDTYSPVDVIVNGILNRATSVSEAPVPESSISVSSLDELLVKALKSPRKIPSRSSVPNEGASSTIASASNLPENAAVNVVMEKLLETDSNALEKSWSHRMFDKLMEKGASSTGKEAQQPCLLIDALNEPLDKSDTERMLDELLDLMEESGIRVDMGDNSGVPATFSVDTNSEMKPENEILQSSSSKADDVPVSKVSSENRLQAPTARTVSSSNAVPRITARVSGATQKPRRQRSQDGKSRKKKVIPREYRAKKFVRRQKKASDCGKAVVDLRTVDLNAVMEGAEILPDDRIKITDDNGDSFVYDFAPTVMTCAEFDDLVGPESGSDSDSDYLDDNQDADSSSGDESSSSSSSDGFKPRTRLKDYWVCEADCSSGEDSDTTAKALLKFRLARQMKQSKCGRNVKTENTVSGNSPTRRTTPLEKFFSNGYRDFNWKQFDKLFPYQCPVCYTFSTEIIDDVTHPEEDCNQANLRLRRAYVDMGDCVESVANPISMRNELESSDDEGFVPVRKRRRVVVYSSDEETTSESSKGVSVQETGGIASPILDKVKEESIADKISGSTISDSAQGSPLVEECDPPREMQHLPDETISEALEDPVSEVPLDAAEKTVDTARTDFVLKLVDVSKAAKKKKKLSGTDAVAKKKKKKKKMNGCLSSDGSDTKPEEVGECKLPVVRISLKRENLGEEPSQHSSEKKKKAEASEHSVDEVQGMKNISTEETVEKEDRPLKKKKKKKKKKKHLETTTINEESTVTSETNSDQITSCTSSDSDHVNTYCCNECSSTFTGVRDTVEHIITEHCKKKYPCFFCPRDFLSWKSFGSHLKFHKDPSALVNTALRAELKLLRKFLPNEKVPAFGTKSELIAISQAALKAAKLLPESDFLQELKRRTLDCGMTHDDLINYVMSLM